MTMGSLNWSLMLIREKILGAHIIGPEASILIQPFIDLMNSGTHVIAPLHPEIASETVKHLRAMPLTRILDPHNVRTLNETMTPHPSLSRSDHVDAVLCDALSI